MSDSSADSSTFPGPPGLSIRMGELTKDNWQQLKRLNLAILPVQYSDKLYHSMYEKTNNSLTKLAFHNDLLVGAIASKKKKPIIREIIFFFQIKNDRK